MRVIIQRVNKASVTVKNETVSKIDKGLLILLGITHEDSSEDVQWLVKRIFSLKLFDSSEKPLSKTIGDSQMEILLISQFTLFASSKKGTKLSFLNAAKPEKAKMLYNEFRDNLAYQARGKVKEGEFGAYMDVESINSGPLTIIIDSKNRE